MEKYRSELTKIDESLFCLLKKRQEVSLKIAECKKNLKLKVVDDKQEEIVIKKNIERAKSLGLGHEYAKEISELLIKYSKISQLENVFNQDASYLKNDIK